MSDKDRHLTSIISGIVVHGRCIFLIAFIFLLFLWLFIGWTLFSVLFSCLLRVFEQPRTHSKLFSFFLINHQTLSLLLWFNIIVYYITKLHYSRLSCIIYVSIILVLFLLFSFYFHFRSPIRFTFTFQILSCVAFVVYLLFLLLHSSFLSLSIPCNYWVKTNNFILFSL